MQEYEFKYKLSSLLQISNVSLKTVNDYYSIRIFMQNIFFYVAKINTFQYPTLYFINDSFFFAGLKFYDF